MVMPLFGGLPPAGPPPIEVYYHDYTEVDPNAQWTGLCPSLAGAAYTDIASLIRGTAPYNAAVVDLFGYARPDVVVTVNGVPVVSIEQTAMNPSGHNIPQRFSFQVRAAELGVPSILYYPQASRRTFSDPNVRYVNPRVPLAQMRLTSIYRTPALSVFWPVDPNTNLPVYSQQAHQPLATLVEAIIQNGPSTALALAPVRQALVAMGACYAQGGANIRSNPTVRALLPNGFPSAQIAPGLSLDPPNKVRLVRTVDLVQDLNQNRLDPSWPAVSGQLLLRPLTLIFTGTTNARGTDSEHPWPGYLTLLDVLYARASNGRTTSDRDHNLVYSLPADVWGFIGQLNSARPNTAALIVDTFADLLLLDGGAVPGQPQRGNAAAFVTVAY